MSFNGYPGDLTATQEIDIDSNGVFTLPYMVSSLTEELGADTNCDPVEATLFDSIQDTEETELMVAP